MYVLHVNNGVRTYNTFFLFSVFFLSRRRGGGGGEEEEEGVGGIDHYVKTPDLRNKNPVYSPN